MAASDARPVPRKNVAFRLYFAYRDDSNDLITDWSTNSADAELSGDTNAFTGSATYIGTPTEIATNTGVGYVDITAAGMNYDCVVIKATITGGNDVVIILYPEEEGDYRVDVVHMEGSTNVDAAIAGYVWDAATADYGVVASYGAHVEGLNAAPSAADVADAVWDEDTTGHTGIGTFGQQCKTDIDAILDDTGEIGTAGAGLSDIPWNNTDWDAEVQSEVNDALVAYDAATGTDITGLTDVSAADVWTYAARTLTNLGSAAVSGDIADAVWDETLSDHDAPNSAGHALVAASGNLFGVNVIEVNGSPATEVNANDIADAVWDEQTDAHRDPGSAGMGLITASGNLISGDWGSSTLAASDVWGYTDRSLTALGDAAVSGDVAAAVWGYAGTRALTTQDWSTHDAAAVYTAFDTGSNLTEVGLSTTALNNVNAEVDTALTDINLDHLMAVAEAGDVVANSALSKLRASDYIWANADTNDTIESIRDTVATKSAIAETVWQRSASGAEVVPGSFGHALVTASGNTIEQDWSTHDAAAVADAVWTENINTHATTANSTAHALVTSSGNLIGGAGTAPSAAANADAVWNRLLGGHLIVDSAGWALGIIASGVVDANIEQVNGLDVVDDGVVDSNVVSVGTAASGDIQEIVEDGLTAYDAATGSDITGLTDVSAADVWTYAARTVTNLGSAAVSGDIADAVWNEPLGEHITIDTTGWALGVIGSGVIDANMVQVSGEYVTLQNIQTGDIDTTGLATTAQLEYWALMILNNCGGGPVG